jgi:hypothetical protein
MQYEHYYTLTKGVLEKYKNPIFFETGTYLGDSVALALEVGFDKVISVEINEELQSNNELLFKEQIEKGRVELHLGDTLLLLDKIVDKIEQPTTFWLDAHYDFGVCGVKRCPLYEELDFIAQSKIKTHTILIDDVRCFGIGNWGEGISVEGVIEKIKNINPNYNIVYEHGLVPNDIMVAYI